MLRISYTREPGPELLKIAKQAVHSLKSLKTSGFMSVPLDQDMWLKASDHGVALATKFSTLGLLGIGGSSLGPKVIQQFLSMSVNKQMHVFENIDPVSFELKIKSIENLETTHWLIVSKSGKTLETLSQLSLILKHYKASKIAHHFTVISDPGQNPLTDWAKAHSVAVYTIPPNVGGRFSVMTPVGIIPAAFMGVSCEEMRAGARSAIDNLDPVEKAAAQTLLSFEKNEWITVFWAYSDLLQYLGGWVQQLWAESLAKRTNRKNAPAPRVSTPLPLVGANDQHSILQQVMEGSRDKFVWFLGVESVEQSGTVFGEELVGLPDFLKSQNLGAILKAERLATQQALKLEGVHSIELIIQDLSPKSLGYLLQFFEMIVASVADALDINAFDQPGVELGKRLAMQILEKS